MEFKTFVNPDLTEVEYNEEAMSGHSKWAQIKRKKGLKDQERGKLFSKLSRAITIAVIDGGGMTDPEHNVKLRMAIEKAHQDNMPKENIQRAVEKGTGPNREQLHEIVYEAFGPSGVMFLIQTTTDNSNRTHSEIKNVLEKKGGKMGNKGSVGYLFQRCGTISFDKDKNKQENVLSLAEQVNAFDIDAEGDQYTIYFPFEMLGRVQQYLKEGVSPSSAAELDYYTPTKMVMTDLRGAKSILGFIDSLESLEDVQKVFTNVDIPSSLLAEITL